MNRNKFKENAIRHGEVMIIPIDRLPKNVEEISCGKEAIIGHSETGHHHVAVAVGAVPDAITIYRPIGVDSQELYMRVAVPSRVEHRKTRDSHETKNLEPGIYQINIKNSYDYFKKALVKVVD